MQLSQELQVVVEGFIQNESKLIFYLLSLSENMERKGLRNITRYLKATAYSKQAIITKLYRNLRIVEEDVNSLKAFYEDNYKKNGTYINQIEEIAKKENLAGCAQTMYFAKETVEKEHQEFDKIFDFIKNAKDVIYSQIAVCPLCGLVITDDLEKCPLCGANKAIFRTF